MALSPLPNHLVAGPEPPAAQEDTPTAAAGATGRGDQTRTVEDAKLKPLTSDANDASFASAIPSGLAF
jgi:hypothetical protein